MKAHLLPPSRVIEIILIFVITLILFSLDVASFLSGAEGRVMLWHSALLSVMMVCVVWWPIWAGSGVIFLNIIGILSPAEWVTTGIADLLVIVLLTLWVMRRLYVAATIGIIIEGLLGLAAHHDPWAVLSSIILIALMCGVGGELIGQLLRRSDSQGQEIKNLIRERDLAESRVRAGLSYSLHDTVCADLVVLVAQCRQLASRSDEGVGEELLKIENRARRALDNIRDVVSVLGVEGAAEIKNQSLIDVLADCEVMVGYRNIRVEKDVPPWPSGEWSRGADTEHILGLVLREAMVNILKYTPSDSMVEVDLEYGDQEISLMVRSPLGERPLTSDDPSLTGGLGLRALRDRVTNMEGTLSARKVQDYWVINCSLPPLTPAIPRGVAVS